MSNGPQADDLLDDISSTTVTWHNQSLDWFVCEELSSPTKSSATQTCRPPLLLVVALDCSGELLQEPWLERIDPFCRLMLPCGWTTSTFISDNISLSPHASLEKSILEGAAPRHAECIPSLQAFAASKPKAPCSFCMSQFSGQLSTYFRLSSLCEGQPKQKSWNVYHIADTAREISEDMLCGVQGQSSASNRHGISCATHV